MEQLNILNHCEKICKLFKENKLENNQLKNIDKNYIIIFNFFYYIG